MLPALLTILEQLPAILVIASTTLQMEILVLLAPLSMPTVSHAIMMLSALNVSWVTTSTMPTLALSNLIALSPTAKCARLLMEPSARLATSTSL